MALIPHSPTHTCMYIYTYTCTYVYICVYKHRLSRMVPSAWKICIFFSSARATCHSAEPQFAAPGLKVPNQEPWANLVGTIPWGSKWRKGGPVYTLSPKECLLFTYLEPWGLGATSRFLLGWHYPKAPRRCSLKHKPWRSNPEP